MWNSVWLEYKPRIPISANLASGKDVEGPVRIEGVICHLNLMHSMAWWSLTWKLAHHIWGRTCHVGCMSFKFLVRLAIWCCNPIRAVSLEKNPPHCSWGYPAIASILVSYLSASCRVSIFYWVNVVRLRSNISLMKVPLVIGIDAVSHLSSGIFKLLLLGFPCFGQIGKTKRWDNIRTTFGP